MKTQFATTLLHVSFYYNHGRVWVRCWVLWLADTRCSVGTRTRRTRGSRSSQFSWFSQGSQSPNPQTILARVGDQLRLLQTELRHPEQLSKYVSPSQQTFTFFVDIISSLSAFCSQFKQLLLFRLSCEQIKTLNAWKFHSQNEHVLWRYLSLRWLKAQLTAPFRKQAFSLALNGLSEISKAQILSGFPVDVCWLLLPSSHQENV